MCVDFRMLNKWTIKDSTFNFEISYNLGKNVDADALSSYPLARKKISSKEIQAVYGNI